MSKIKFRYLPHTADIRFVSYGDTFKEAFENAARALLNIMLDTKRISRENSKVGSITIKESARTKEDLVWYVLQDILSKIDEKSLKAFDFKITKLEEAKRKLSGKLFFKDTDKDYSLLEVKAITPHDLKVEKAKKWRIHVLVDV
ncbi:MAG: archease [Candidatus Micrarchaeota archaeon]